MFLHFVAIVHQLLARGGRALLRCSKWRAACPGHSRHPWRPGHARHAAELCMRRPERQSGQCEHERQNPTKVHQWCAPAYEEIVDPVTKTLTRLNPAITRRNSLPEAHLLLISDG